MQIVIEIEDYDKEWITNGYYIPEEINIRISEAIANGTPLLKGHGRLIDADELIQDIKEDSQLCYFNSKSEEIIHDKMVDFAVDRIADAPTIILANKEEEE